MRKGVVGIFIFMFLFSFASAEFEIGNVSHSLTQSTYGSGANVQGWINMSFTDEAGDSIFQDSRSNRISLIDLLKLNSQLSEGTDYTCSTDSCIDDYSSSDPTQAKNFVLKSGDSKLFGIRFTDSLSDINSISFNVTSTAASSCNNQIEIDFLADGIIDKGNTQNSFSNCDLKKSKGCFNSSLESSEHGMGTFPNKHCQKIELTSAPSFELGANIKRNGYTGNINMSLYSLSNELIQNTTCTLPLTDGEIGCNIDFQIYEPEEYYVCVYTQTDSGTAKIRGYKDNTNCGFYESSGNTNEGTFDLFMVPKKFGGVGTIEIINALEGDHTLGNLVKNYLMQTYGNGMVCSISNACYVPIQFNSNANQAINISGISIDYDTTLGSGTSQKVLYDLVQTPPTITADFIKMNFGQANFTASTKYGNSTFKLKFEGDTIFSKILLIKKVPTIQGLSPLSAAQGFPTTFRASLEYNMNNTNYGWNFGDNSSTKTGTTKEIIHTYSKLGTYNLQVKVSDGTTSSVKNFTITIVSPEDKIDEKLKELEKNLANIEGQIESLDYLSKERLKAHLNLTNIGTRLTQIQRDFERANTNAEFLEIIPKILEIGLPTTIIKTKNADSITYLSQEDYIDLAILKIIGGGGDYDSNQIQEYKTAVILWNQENIDMKITYREFSEVSDLILNVFKLEISGINLNDTAYFIIEDLKDLSFDKNYGQIQESGYFYFKIENLPQSITFSTTQEVNFADVPLFISTNIDSLPGLEKITKSKEKEFKWAILGLIIFILLILGIITYVVLQIWYKKKYETYLFKNKNNLYNIIHYINNAKKHEMENSEIEKNLRKTGWTGEQIAYVMKKYSGKRTGMYELPIDKALNIFDKGKAPTAPKINPGQRPRMPQRVIKKFNTQGNIQGNPQNKFKKY